MRDGRVTSWAALWPSTSRVVPCAAFDKLEADDDPALG